MDTELEVLDRLRAERMALLRERDELLLRGSEAMRRIQGLRVARKSDPIFRRMPPPSEPIGPVDRSVTTVFRSLARPAPDVASTPGEGRRVPVTQGPADLA